MTRTQVEAIRDGAMQALNEYWQRRHSNPDNHWLDIRQWEATVEMHAVACRQLESMTVGEKRPIAFRKVTFGDGQHDAITEALGYLKLITFVSGDEARYLNRAVSALAAAMKAKAGGT